RPLGSASRLVIACLLQPSSRTFGDATQVRDRVACASGPTLATERARARPIVVPGASAPPLDGAEQLAVGGDRAELARPEAASRKVYGALAGRNRMGAEAS